MHALCWLVLMSSVMWGLSNFFRIMFLKVAESILRCQEGKFLTVYKDTHIKIREMEKKKKKNWSVKVYMY